MPKAVAGLALAWALLFILTAGACRTSEAGEGVVVLAAASLTEVLEEIGSSFETEAGVRVHFSYGGSDTLAGQVRRGAPADAVVFAGADPLDGLEADGLTVASSRRNVASNRLVVIAARGSGARITDLSQLAAGQSGKLAVADPQLAPAGRYARAALEAAGVWRQLGGRLIPGLDVRNAAAAVTAGNARFGIVYQTDADSIEGVELVLVVPAALYPPIVYPAAVVASAASPDGAGRFLSYLASPDASAAFRRHGFLPPP